MNSEGNGANSGNQSSYENLKLVDQHYLIQETSKKRMKLVCALTGMDYYGDKCVHVYRFRCSNRLTEGCKAQVTTDNGVNVILNESLVHSCVRGAKLYKEYDKRVNETNELVQSYLEQIQNPNIKQQIPVNEESKSEEIEDNQSWRWCHECTRQMMVGTLIPNSCRCQHYQLDLLSGVYSDQSSSQKSTKSSRKRLPSQGTDELEQSIGAEGRSWKQGQQRSEHLEKGDLSQTLLLSNQSQASNMTPDKDAIIERLSKQLSALQNDFKLLSGNGKSETKHIINDPAHEDEIVFRVQMERADFEIRGNEWVVKQKS